MFMDTNHDMCTDINQTVIQKYYPQLTKQKQVSEDFSAFNIYFSILSFLQTGSFVFSEIFPEVSLLLTYVLRAVSHFRMAY